MRRISTSAEARGLGVGLGHPDEEAHEACDARGEIGDDLIDPASGEDSVRCLTFGYLTTVPQPEEREANGAPRTVLARFPSGLERSTRWTCSAPPSGPLHARRPDLGIRSAHGPSHAAPRLLRCRHRPGPRGAPRLRRRPPEPPSVGGSPRRPHSARARGQVAQLRAAAGQGAGWGLGGVRARRRRLGTHPLGRGRSVRPDGLRRAGAEAEPRIAPAGSTRSQRRARADAERADRTAARWRRSRSA